MKCLDGEAAFGRAGANSYARRDHDLTLLCSQIDDPAPRRGRTGQLDGAGGALPRNDDRRVGGDRGDWTGKPLVEAEDRSVLAGASNSRGPVKSTVSALDELRVRNKSIGPADQERVQYAERPARVDAEDVAALKVQ